MMGKSHMTFGTGCGVAALALMGVNPLERESVAVYGIALSLATFASLMPDMDVPNATVWSTLGIGPQQAKKNPVSWVGHQIVKAITSFIPHRGFTHWLITWLALSVIVTVGFTFLATFIERPVQSALIIGVAFAVGYVSHIFADTCTMSGVAIFAPFVSRSFHALPRPVRIRTGTPYEMIILIILLVLCAIVTLIGYGFHFYLLPLALPA
jgi:inner membrane protein